MDDNEGEEWWMEETSLREIRDNDPDITSLNCDENWIQEMTDENWEQLGRDIANNTHLREVDLFNGALNDRTASFLFQGLTRSSSIKNVNLYENQFSAAGIRGMVTFLQNANNLTELDLSDNNIQSEGFNVLFRALRDSPVERLNCQQCGIESIEIDSEHTPRHLKHLFLSGNSINADGCYELAKLLRGGDATLEFLSIPENNIDDEGVEILVEALQSNTSLRELYLQENGGISKQGSIMLLKLVNDVSSIEATLRSNHTLTKIFFFGVKQSLQHIKMATAINRLSGEAGRSKVIETQLNSVRRAEVAELQGVSQSLYSEINPLHLPEVLALVARHHGQGELYVALKSSIAGVISTVDRKECLKQQIAEKRAEIEAAESELAEIGAAEVHAVSDESRSSNKRRRS